MITLPRNRRQLALDVLVPTGLLLALWGVVALDNPLPVADKVQMDIVFILDEGAGLAESAEAIKQGWLNTAESFTKQNIDCRFAVIPCHPDSKQVPRIGWTTDVAKLKRKLTKATSDLKTSADAWPVTDSLHALDEVLKLDFREHATARVYLATNKLVEDLDRLQQIAGKLQDRKIATIIQANSSDEDRFHALYKKGGQFYTLSGKKKIDNLKPLKIPRKNSAQKRTSKSILDPTPVVIAPAARQTPKTEQTLVGVKVRGKIALVCDISGSMKKDFPPLVEELRKNFPIDTPLILVQGCHFAAPNSDNQTPTKLSQTERSQEVLGVDLSKDQHVFFAENTTDAVLMAVTQFRRDTVMFNNDLQDGGSPKAIAAFQAHHKQYGFTLSGRSLNRDAPQVLKDFIKKAGGDFKVNPINREVGAAINWRPMDLVFVLDEGDGMDEAAGKIKEIWLKIAKSLKSQGMDCRFAVLPCRPKSDQIPRIPLTSDVAELERLLQEAKPSGSGKAVIETDTLQALEDVLKLDFRKDASPIVFLITNSSVKDKDRLAELAKTFNEREIETIIQANASDQVRFRPLYSQRGQFYTMAGEKKTERKTENSDLKTKSQNVDFDDLLSTLGQDSSEEPILQGIYTKVAGRSVIAGTRKDKFGNPVGSQYDLGRDGAFKGLQIAVIQLYSLENFDFSLPQKALEIKGFSIHRWFANPPSADELKKVLDKSSQLWLISDRSQKLNADHLKVITEFFESGRGVYVWGDNDPFFTDANYVTNALVKSQLQGNLLGDKVVGRKTAESLRTCLKSDLVVIH